MTPTKRKHVARSLERHIAAPRLRAWTVLLDEIERLAGGYVIEGSPAPHGAGAVLHLRFGDGDPLVETVLSFEPPWRRCYRVEGPATHLDFYEGTFVIRDDGDECHLSWGVVVDPEPTDEGLAFLEVAIAAIDSFLGRVAAVAEAAA